MKSPAHKRFTVDNNLNATHNVLCAIVESELDIHLVHLGTMGVYGYGSAGLKIPEGYLKVKVEVGLSPEEELIQDSLKAAMDAADAIGNDKLSDQIGNTITFFTREYVVGNR